MSTAAVEMIARECLAVDISTLDEALRWRRAALENLAELEERIKAAGDRVREGAESVLRCSATDAADLNMRRASPSWGPTIEALTKDAAALLPEFVA